MLSFVTKKHLFEIRYYLNTLYIYDGIIGRRKMAPNFDLSQIQSTLNQAMSRLGSMNGSDGTSSLGGGSNYVNSVWGLVQQGQTAVNGNEGQKAQAITNIVQNLMGMLMSLGTNENSKATKEVKKNEAQAEKLEKNANETTESTETAVEDIVKNIADNTTSISQAMEKIKELGGDNGQIAEAQEQLEEQLEIIEENKQILNDGVSSPEAKEAALQALLGAASAINGLVESIGEVQKEIEVQNGIVETASDNVSGLIEESVTQITNGIQALQGYIKEGGVQTVTNTTTSATGSANEIVGAQATAMGSASNAVPIVGSTAGSKLIRIGTDQTSAGATRIQGAVKNISALTKSIGEMGSDLNKIANFVNSVGNVGNEFTELVGQYGAQLEPVITATGSWSAVADANAQFEEAIAEYQSNTGMTLEMPWEKGSENQASENSNQTYLNFTGSTQAENSSVASGQFEFDTNIFREAFEKQGA